jgi:hypothetical protein
MMPRFSSNALLIGVAVIAMWLATFSIPQNPPLDVGYQIRSAMVLAVWILAGGAALYFRGKRQAFWLGFFVTMTMVWAQSGLFVKPNFSALCQGILAAMAPSVTIDQEPIRWLHSTLMMGFILAFSALVGFGVSIVYDRRLSKN